MKNLINALNTNSLLLIIGLIFQLIGALLVSVEAFGIEEYLKFRNDGVVHHQRWAELSLNATLNNTSVFVFINSLWFVILLFFLKLPLKISISLFLLGYYVWKLIIYISKKLISLIDIISFTLPENPGCLLLLVSAPYYLAWFILYSSINIIVLAIEFGLDIPVRYFSEKIISRSVLFIFTKIYELLKKMKNDAFKKPIYIGVLFIILGFIYQFLGTILSI